MPEREDGNDDFGMADEDWDVYREIQKDGFSEDEVTGDYADDQSEEEYAEVFLAKGVKSTNLSEEENQKLIDA